MYEYSNLTLVFFPVILDSDGSTCHDVQSLIDTDTTDTRSWTIHVSQYTCQDPYSGGPPGCLQYHYDSGLSKTGTISNFGYDRSATTIATTSKYCGIHDIDITCQK